MMMGETISVGGVIVRFFADHEWVRIALFVLTAWMTAAAFIFIRDRAFRIALLATALVVGLLVANVITWGDLHAALADDAATTFLGLMAFVAAWIGAQAAIRSLERAALDTAANAFLDLRNRYHAAEMGSAIKLLAEFAIPIKEETADLWTRKLNADDFRAIGKILSTHRDELSPAERDELKRATRLASGYFNDVGFLLKHKMLSPETTRSFLNVAGLNIFYEVCVPLQAVDNKNSASIEYARLLRTVMKRQGVGMIRYDSTDA